MIFEFDLYCRAVDSGDSAASGTGTATLTVSITNVNEAPAFAMTQYSATIPDGSTASTYSNIILNHVKLSLGYYHNVLFLYIISRTCILFKYTIFKTNFKVFTYK